MGGEPWRNAFLEAWRAAAVLGAEEAALLAPSQGSPKCLRRRLYLAPSLRFGVATRERRFIECGGCVGNGSVPFRSYTHTGQSVGFRTRIYSLFYHPKVSKK